MNGSYYPNPTFPGNSNNYDVNMNGVGNPNNMSGIGNMNQGNMSNANNDSGIAMEQSYIENILRLNKGKMVSAYVSFPDSTEWRNKIFRGRIEEAGRDHLIISNPSTGEWDLILMIYLNYVTFDERINYSHSYSEKTF